MPKGKTIEQVLVIDGVSFSHEMTAAKNLGMPRETLARYRKEGISPAYYILNNKPYYKDSDLLKFMEDQRVSSAVMR